MNMKNNIRKLSLVLIGFGVITMQMGCGGISPGDGPGFPESMTASDLFHGVSQSLYLPDEVPTEGSESINGSFDCEGGGKVTIQSDISENSDGGTASVSYSNCKGVRYINGTGYQLTMNGSVNISSQYSENQIHSSFNQSMSYGGDLGFAATCDYSFTINSESASAEGDCTYEDSEGKTLKHNLDSSTID